MLTWPRYSTVLLARPSAHVGFFTYYVLTSGEVYRGIIYSYFDFFFGELSLVCERSRVSFDFRKYTDFVLAVFLAFPRASDAPLIGDMVGPLRTTGVSERRGDGDSRGL